MNLLPTHQALQFGVISVNTDKQTIHWYAEKGSDYRNEIVDISNGANSAGPTVQVSQAYIPEARYDITLTDKLKIVEHIRNVFNKYNFAEYTRLSVFSSFFNTFFQAPLEEIQLESNVNGVKLTLASSAETKSSLSVDMELAAMNLPLKVLGEQAAVSHLN